MYVSIIEKECSPLQLVPKLARSTLKATLTLEKIVPTCLLYVQWSFEPQISCLHTCMRKASIRCPGSCSHVCVGGGETGSGLRFWWEGEAGYRTWEWEIGARPCLPMKDGLGAGKGEIGLNIFKGDTCINI